MEYYELLNIEEANELMEKEGSDLVKITRELLKNKSDLYVFFANKFGYRLDRENWNWITDSLTYEEKEKKRTFCILHVADISSEDLVSEDLEGYFFTIFASLDFHFSKKKGLSCMRDEIHFRVVFVYKDEKDKKEKQKIIKRLFEKFQRTSIGLFE